MPKPSTQQLGQHAEQHACNYLQAQGLSLITQNFYSKYGEIDLVMLDKQQTLVFVEVRYRSSNRFGGAVASVTLSKQRKIIATARYFLYCYPQYARFNIRFDVLAIDKQGNNTITWLPAAFLVDD